MPLALIFKFFNQRLDFIFILIESVLKQYLLLTALSQVILESLEGHSLFLQLMVQIFYFLTMSLDHELLLLLNLIKFDLKFHGNSLFFFESCIVSLLFEFKLFILLNGQFKCLALFLKDDVKLLQLFTGFYLFLHRYLQFLLKDVVPLFQLNRYLRLICHLLNLCLELLCQLLDHFFLMFFSLFEVRSDFSVFPLCDADTHILLILYTLTHIHIQTRSWLPARRRNSIHSRILQVRASGLLNHATAHGITVQNTKDASAECGRASYQMMVRLQAVIVVACEASTDVVVTSRPGTRTGPIFLRLLADDY